MFEFASNTFAEWAWLLVPLIKILALVFGAVMPLVAYASLAERKVSAVMQDRVGPNRTGLPLTLLGFKKDLNIAGLFQPLADGLKFLLKEDFTPNHVRKFYFWLAPALAVAPALLSIAVIPFGSSLNIAGTAHKMVVADLNVGFLYVFAITSIAVYGIVIAGWASNSKYSFLGGVRSSAQMISYELSMGLALIPLILLMGTLNLGEMVRYQAAHGWSVFPLSGLVISWKNGFSMSGIGLREILLWLPMVISFFIFLISIFAETNRAPFDLPESETELVGGYHTEYSSMKFALFFMGEYAALVTGCGLIATLFLGGWGMPLPVIADSTLSFKTFTGADGNFWGLFNIATFFGKVILLIVFFMFVRWTVPRFRYDQLMKLGWVWMFELALANIVIAALVIAFVK